MNHYGSPITGREGTFRLPRRVRVFTGLVYSTFILQPSRANGSKKYVCLSLFTQTCLCGQREDGRGGGLIKVDVCVWFLVKFLWITWRRLINFYHDSSLFFFNSECRDKCTLRGINERYLHVDNSLT